MTKIVSFFLSPTHLNRKSSVVLHLQVLNSFSLLDLLVDQTDQSHISNGIVDSKTQTILTTAAAANKAHFSPIGPIHLTAEECNEILMKRALAATHPQTITSNDGHNTTTSKA